MDIDIDTSSRRGSSSKEHGGFDTNQPDTCECGLKLRLQTSWTPTNPGRRFSSCPQRIKGCGTFCWCDPPMCDRSKQIIPGLIKRINALQAQAEMALMNDLKNKKTMTKSYGWFVPYAVAVVLICIVLCISFS
ncbi:hypothetical protein ABFS83_14G126000 [Erythranthe nasuta]